MSEEPCLEEAAGPDCARCGASLRTGARYCPACGTPLDGAPSARRPPGLRAGAVDLGTNDPTLRRSIVFFVIWCLSGVAAAWAGNLKDGNIVPILLLIQGLDAAFTGGWALAFRRQALSLFARLRGGMLPLLLPLLLAWPFAFAIHLFVTGLHRGFSIQIQNYSMPYLEAGYGWGVIVLSVCLQPAFVEELAFRGILQSGLEDLVRPAEAAFIAAVGFSIMHFNLVMFLPLACLGLYLGWLRRWSGSLWPPVIAHGLHNLIVLLDERSPMFPL